MIHKIRSRFLSTYLSVVSSIAFYPAFISFSLFLLSFLFLRLENHGITEFLIENAPYLVIDNAETARSILSTLIGGIISLTVFSFSMVMVLLSQASSNFSPRLLPGLISDKRNQVVLGFYLGTIIYNIIVLISIEPSGDKYTLNGFSLLSGIVLGIASLGMFVFFIHSISTGIQINNILEKIFRQSKERLELLIEKKANVSDSVAAQNNWETIKSESAGYYQGVDLDGLQKFAKSKQLKVLLLPYKGEYLLPNNEVIKYNKKLEEEDIVALHDFIIYSNSHNVNENYVLGIKQIAEVGIKAMSPGINDPGTAVMTLDYLTELIALRMQLDETEIYIDEENDYKVELSTVNFENLIYQSLAAYRQYCKHDIILMEKMIQMLHYLRDQDCKHGKYNDSICKQLEILKADIQQNIENESDKSKLLDMLENNCST